MRVPYTLALLLLLLPLKGSGQVAENEPPLPNMKGVSIAIQLHYSTMPPHPYQDTLAVFLVGGDGYAHTAYLGALGSCNAKELYAYQDGQLIRRTHFNSLDPHGLFVSPEKHSHYLVSEDTWTYQHGRLSLTRHFAGPAKTLTREVRYTYNSEGRLATESSYYPKQSLLYYPAKFDYVLYRYIGDSVCTLSYSQGSVQGSFAYLERHNRSGLVSEWWQISKDGKHFDRELKQYDSSGRITILEALSDRPTVQRDGTVLRADRVEYYYDEKGRPYETRYFARGIKRWSYRYDYLTYY